MAGNWKEWMSRWWEQPRHEMWVRLAAVLILFALVNHVSFRHHGTVDFTRDHRFTLDSATQRFLRELDSEVALIALFSSGSDVFSDMRCLLDQVQRQSRGNVTVEFLDPVRHPGRSGEVQAKYGVRLKSNALIVAHGNRHKVVAEEDMIFRDAGGLVNKFGGEISLVGAMIEVLEEKPKKVYIVTGFQRPDFLREVFAEMKELGSGQNLQVEFLNLGVKQEVPDDADALMLTAPQVDLPEPEMERLKKYWGSRGGALFLTLDPDVPLPRLEAFLKRLGVVLRKDRVVYSPQGLTGRTQKIFSVPARIRGGSAVGRYLEGLTLTLEGRSQSLQLLPDAEAIRADNIHLTPLLVADDSYWGETEYDADSVRRDRTKDHFAPLYLGTVVERGAVEDPNLRVQTQRLVLVSNPTLLATGERKQKLQADLVLSALNWLMDRGKLIGITPQEPTRYAVILSPGTLESIERFAVVILPGVVGAIGVLVWFLRRR